MIPSRPTTTSIPRKGAAVIAVCLSITGAGEGVRLKAYRDTGGVPTICMGETRNVHMGDTATLAQCNQMFEGRLYEFYDGVRGCTGGVLMDSMPVLRQASLVDLAYNIGIGRYCKSAINRNLKAGNIEAACASMLKYSYVGPVFIPGLYNRRLRNQQECLAK